MATMTQRLDLDDTFGAMYIGAMISMGLYGITTLQTFFYFRNYERDDLEVKALVCLLQLPLNLRETHRNGTGDWRLPVVQWKDSGYSPRRVHVPCHALLPHCSLWNAPNFVDGDLVSLCVVVNQYNHCLYISNLLHEKDSLLPFKWFLTTATGLIVLAHFVFGIATVVYFYLLKDFSRLKEADHVAVVPFGVTAVVSDIVVAAALVMLLDRSRTEFEETNSLINKLIVLAINRCVLTSVVAIIEVILFLTIRNSLYAFAIDFIIGKCEAIFSSLSTWWLRSCSIRKLSVSTLEFAPVSVKTGII
ncbi:hypothetical protein WG66_008602 [Moniliophthora roreri]|nr:hypothetical protein WG66_008602 [Moniliophthora roreri]